MAESRKVESWEIGRVLPYVKNAKIHDPAQVAKIARSIKEYGWDQPIVVDKDGVVIKGHGRRLAAIELGMKFVPVIVRDDLSEEKVRASRLADNRVAEGDTDTELLHEELAELIESQSVDIDAMGFDERELDFFTDDLGEMDVDSLIDDLDAEVTEQTERAEKTTKEAGDKMVGLAEAFGFKQLTVDQARSVNKFMAKLEDDTGLRHADALMDFVEKLTAEW